MVYFFFISTRNGAHMITKFSLERKVVMKPSERKAWEKTQRTGRIVGVAQQVFFDFSLPNPEYAELIMIFEAKTCVYFKDAPESDATMHRSTRKSEDLRAACQAVTDANADMATRAIADGIDSGAIRSGMTPQQLMRVVWGRILGILQILQIRKKHFHNAYGISHETLFNRFMEMAEKGLAPPEYSTFATLG